MSNMWSTVTVGEIAEIRGGKRLPKGEDFAETPTPFPYIRVTDFDRFSIDVANLKYLRPETQAEISRYTINSSDVYISIAGSIGIVGMIPPALDGANLTENAAKLVTNKHAIDPCFLMYSLASDSVQQEIRGQTVKNAQPKLALARIASLQVSLPPLPEQRKIAGVLGVVQRAIEQQEQQLQLTMELKKTLLHKLFTEGLRGEPQKQTEIGLVPERWEVARLSEVAVLKSGGTPSRIKPEYWVGGSIPWVKTGEVDYCAIHDSEEKITAAGLANSSAKLFPPGTLLMAMYGQGITRGKVAILHIEAATNQACIAILPNKKLGSKFLYYFLENQYESLRKLGHGANQKNLSADIIKAFIVAYPDDTSEQDEIVQILEEAYLKIQLIKKKKGALADLFHTLLHQLMTARIRVNEFDLPDLGIGGGG